MGYLHTDVPELQGYDSGIVLTNLSRLQVRQARLDEQTLAGLWALADAVLHDSGGDPDVIDSILLSLQDGGGPDDPFPAVQLPENREPAARLAGHAGLYARLLLYRFLREKQGRSALTDVLPPLPAGAGENRISYMKSAQADKAYLRFSAVLPDCRFSQAHSFVDACEEVYNGVCRFCLLPLEVSGEGRLTAFSRLIVKYRLVVAAACDVVTQTPADSRTMRFGLLCRGSGDDAPFGGLAGTDIRYVELLHTTPSSPSLTDLLTAADFCGLLPVRADTLPPESYDVTGDVRQPPIGLVLEVPPDADPAVFMRFVALEASEDVFLGAYGLLPDA